jgi:hypothetical protein
MHPRRLLTMVSISQAEVRRLVAEDKLDEAVETAYVMLSERFEVLPDGGDELFRQLFTPDECEAMADVLAVAKNGSLRP